MPNEITLEQARAIIDARDKLTGARKCIAALAGATNVKVEVTYAAPQRGYHSNTETLRYEGRCHLDQLSRSMVDGIRQHWARKESEAIRTLRQLGAEVPSS
jgi:hypothetical protein